MFFIELYIMLFFLLLAFVIPEFFVNLHIIDALCTSGV